MRIRTVFALVPLLLATLATLGTAHAAKELHILSSNALKEVLQEVAPDFERTSGYKLIMEFGSSTSMKRKVEAGSPFDIVIVTPRMVADLAQEGKLTAGTDRQVARVGIGVVIRAGASKPDISTATALRQALLNAKSVMYNKEGQSGLFMAGLMERLGIAEQMRQRTVLKSTAGPVAADIARGDAELGFQQISEIVGVPGVQLVGPLPAELQNYLVFDAGIATSSRETAAARDLIDLLARPEVAHVMTKYGIEQLTH